MSNNFFTHDERQQVKALAVEYGLPIKTVMEALTQDLSTEEASFEDIVAKWNLIFSKRLSKQKYYTIEDVMAVTGKSREEVEATTDKLRADVAANGENPDDYVVKIEY